MPRKKKADQESKSEITKAAAPAPPEDPELAILRAFPFAKRVDQVMRWMISGQRDIDILESIAAAWPDQDCTALMTAVLKEFEESGSLPPPFVKGLIYQSRLECYRQMVEIGDFGGALRALRDIEDALR